MPQRTWTGLSGSALKVIAVVTMLIDHIAVILFYAFPDFFSISLGILGQTYSIYQLLRKIGRLAFPIFCFLITEGYRHTRDKKLYALRLFAFALISEIPYDLIRYDFLNLTGQNVYFTLFFGLVLIRIFDYDLQPLKKFLFMAAVCILAHFFGADYGLKGVLLVLVLHILRNHKAARAIVAYPLLSGGIAAAAAFIPISLYNGQRGFIQSRFWKLAFYAFYPLHILLLVGIRQLCLL